MWQFIGDPDSPLADPPAGQPEGMTTWLSGRRLDLPICVGGPTHGAARHSRDDPPVRSRFAAGGRAVEDQMSHSTAFVDSPARWKH